ncbi:MAG: hypothetical protein LUD29_00745 [Clostridia bacterium]|nr:hypothetical protein [Clostridia bacterium]
MDKLGLALFWDVYRELLTDTQKDICDMYFNLDLTVSEIAEEKDISRQAVSECVGACKKQLSRLEDSLGFVKRLAEAEKVAYELAREISAAEEKYAEVLPATFKEELSGILGRYSGKE